MPRDRLREECIEELCVQGGPPCPAGRTCTVPPGFRQAGCVAPKGPATCEGRKQCPVDAPICVENAGKLQCVAENTPDYMAAKPGKHWGCTRQGDCHAGDSCSYTYGESRPASALDTRCARMPSGIEGTLVCDPAGPSLCGRGGHCGLHCVPNGGPPWMGAWVSKP